MMAHRDPRGRRGPWLALSALVVALGWFLAMPSVGDAATLVVNSTAEEGVNNAPNGQCTLYEALTNVSNGSAFFPDCVAGNGNNDTINFNIPAGQCPGGVCTIVMANTHAVSRPVTINGYSQPGASPNTLAVGNNASIRIVLDGANVVPNGLTINGNEVIIRGLSIGRFTRFGVLVASGSGARVFGSFIGVAPDGNTARPNLIGGIHIEAAATNTVIGTIDPANRNVISGHTNGPGIRIDNGGHGVHGNYIGTNAAGSASLRNFVGILVTAVTDSSILIGGTCSGCGGNLISGNNRGILVERDGKVRIRGNLIGTDATGVSRLGNTDGIFIFDGSDIIIGGRTPAERNIISGNIREGVGVFAPVGALRSGRVVEGNYIGANVQGASLGNGGYGLLARGYTTVGGTEPGAGNLIAFNGGVGVLILDTNNLISGNAIFANTLLGIDIGHDGVTVNDVGDVDGGPNRLQNFPVLTLATVGATTAVDGTLPSTPSRTYRVEFFASTSCDPTGFGEGEQYLGFVNVTADGAGNASFSATFPAVSAGRFATATATDLSTNETSEFSSCLVIEQVAVPPPPPPPPPAITIATTRSAPNRLLVTVTARSGQTLDRIEWTPPPNGRVEAHIGTPVGNGAVMPPGATIASFTLIRTGGSSVTLPFTVTGSFGTWRSFVGGGPSAFGP